MAESNKVILFSAGKFYVFVTPFRYPSLFTEGQKVKTYPFKKGSTGNTGKIHASAAYNLKFHKINIG
jgi:hypothetical protein